MNNYNPLLSGKSNLQKIVNIEVSENEATVFTEENGIINRQIVPNKYWVLTPKRIPGAHKLEGDLYYQYGTQFVSSRARAEFLSKTRKTRTETFVIWDNKESLMVKDGYTYFKGMTHTEPSILSFDIESTGLFHNDDSKVLLISNTFRKSGAIIRKLFSYDEYSSPAEMLKSWCSWIREMDPSIICGHNIYSYDLPYLNYIAQKEGTTLDLGRDCSNINIFEKPSDFRVDGSRSQKYNKVRIYGRDVIDTMFLAIKHDVAAKKYESYGLKAIIKAEGLEKSDRQHYDSSRIRYNYKDPVEWRKIRDYCIHDSDDGLAVFDLCAPAFFYLTQSVPKSFQSVVESATGSQINSMMIRSYLQEGHSLPKASLNKPFEGAISLGNPGIYRNVHKVDVASLYPSIILECKVYDEDKDPKGNFLKIMETFTNERLKNKKLAKESKYHDDLQNAQKIVINSGYGFMGAPGLLFNSPGAAEFITRTGREILESALSWAKHKNYHIPNADTDSISYTKYDQSEITEEEQKANLKEVNLLFPEKIKFEDDGYFPTVVILKAKNYILYDGKKLKYKGSAIKATQKEPALKEFIKRVIDSIIEGKQDFIELYNEYVKEAAKMPDIKRWATRKTISSKTLNSQRANETRIVDAIKDTEIVEGDRAYFFYKTPTELQLVDKFDGNYDLAKLLEKCYNTAWTFDSVIDCDMLFPNYKLKKNQSKLQELINGRS